jgi:multidrug efflux pump
MWLTRFSIQRPIVVAMFFIALAVFGLISLAKLGRSLNPNVTFPIVVVTADYPGASPAEMERLVIKPIEDQIDGIDNLDRMSATAQEGTAAVVVQFKIDTNIDFAAIDVQRRVDTARVYMPTDLDPPLVDKSAGSQQSPILTLALSSRSMSATALSDLVDARIVPDIKHIPNVHIFPTFRASYPAAKSSASSTSRRIPSGSWGPGRRYLKFSTRSRRTTPTCPAGDSIRRRTRRMSRSIPRS